MRACINNQQIRHHNKCVILELLYRQKRANKSTLARLAQISIPAVSNILQELESEKRVVNIDDESQTRGHSSGTWLIAPEGDWTLCLNVTPTSIECQVANACLSPKGEFEYLQIDAPTPQALLSEIEKCWHRHRKLWPDRTINLALAIHGQVDPVTGVSQTMPQAPWATPIEVKYLLEEKLGIRVMVDNDCVMLALAEKCPPNDCRVYLNIFNAARELDAALDSLDADGAPALALRKALRERVGELAEMMEDNYAVEQYRKGGGAK